MSESVYGVELPTLRDAIAAHELQGYEDLGPYIFTKVSNKKKGTSSSGFGPGQITASTAEDMLARYPSLFDDEFRDYVNRFVIQGTNKLNLDYYGSLYKDGDRIETSKADREMFGPLGKGNIPEEDHAKFYNRLFDLVIRDKAKNAKDLNSFLQNYHGAGIGGTQKNIDYAESVQKKLEGLGVSVAGAADPAGFGGESMPLPMPKPEREAMPMPTPKPDREQYIDQEGEIADTGEDVEMEEPGLFERIKPYIPVVRHFDEGGMAKQMELFENGGLRQEGGTVDPVSGNDVPPGSLQEEVRDDIPAQLSEGEFVFPADVVRYIGLEKLMQMRQEAKQGLQMMEDMGQMGNGDEAVMPDDIPFDLSDLDMDDDLEYNVGGFVPGVQQQQQFTGIAGYRPPQMQQGVGSYVPAQMPQYQTTQMPGAYVPPQQAAVPTMQVPTQMPQFGQFTEQNVETREYTNSETGEKRVFTFINGQPTVPIPPGFVPSSEYVKPETAKPVQEQVTTETTRVTEDDPSEPMDPEKIQRMKDRIQAARDLGYLGAEEFTTAGFLAGLTGKGEAGQVTGTGYVLDGKGNLFDPLNGQMVPKNIVEAISRDFDEFGLSQFAKDKMRQAKAQETEFGKDLFDRMVNKGIDNRFDEYLKEADKESDPNARSSAREYALNVKREVKEQAKKGNVGTDGRIINPAETARGKVRAKTRSSVPSASEAAEARRNAEIRRQAEAQRQADAAAATSQRDDDESDRQGAPTGNSYSASGVSRTASSLQSERSGGRRETFARGFAEGGLASKPKPKAKKMKRGGLASKK